MKHPLDWEPHLYEAFREHVENLTEKSLQGDLDAVRTLGMLVLLLDDEADPPDPGVEWDEEDNVIYLDFRIAA